MKPQPTKSTRAWGTIIVLLAIATIVFFVLRLQTGTGFRETQIDSGFAHLSRALTSQNPSDFAEAEERFLNASKMSVLDHEAVFLLKTTQRLSDPTIDSPRPHQDIVSAIRAGKIENAQRLITTLGDDGTKPRIYYEKLVSRLQPD